MWLRVWGPSETLPQPTSDAGEVAARTCLRVPPTSRFEVFEMRRLLVDQETGGHSESRALGRVRQSGDTERAPDAHRPVENGACSGPGLFRHHIEHGFPVVQRLRKLSMKFLQPNGHFLRRNGRPDAVVFARDELHQRTRIMYFDAAKWIIE